MASFGSGMDRPRMPGCEEDSVVVTGELISTDQQIFPEDLAEILGDVRVW
jgi:hypothetical protein